MSSCESFQKTNEWIHFYYLVSDVFSFVFGRNWRLLKKYFEIIWPLTCAKFFDLNWELWLKIKSILHWIIFYQNDIKNSSSFINTQPEIIITYLRTRTTWIGNHDSAKMTMTTKTILTTRFLLRILSAEAWPAGPCLHNLLSIILYIPQINNKGKT